MQKWDKKYKQPKKMNVFFEKNEKFTPPTHKYLIISELRE